MPAFKEALRSCTMRWRPREDFFVALTDLTGSLSILEDAGECLQGVMAVSVIVRGENVDLNSVSDSQSDSENSEIESE